ncbi:hypothetical protein [Alteromonas antoniana]|uniref:hypothetical protein n=1 Tax=Alteromonas antoniana TaxID=2803813 RepID=UPI001C4977EC|nr:hypothetical protein [Alteromonas antoniana]
MKIVKLVLALLAAFIVVGGVYIAYTIHLQTKQQEQETAAENEILNREFKPVVESYIDAFNRCEINEMHAFLNEKRRLSEEAYAQSKNDQDYGLWLYCKKLSFDIVKVRTLRQSSENKASVRVDLNVTYRDSGVNEEASTTYNKWNFVKEDGKWRLSNDSFRRLVGTYNDVL